MLNTESKWSREFIEARCLEVARMWQGCGNLQSVVVEGVSVGLVNRRVAKFIPSLLPSADTAARLAIVKNVMSKYRLMDTLIRESV